MAGFSDVIENSILDLVFRNQAFSAPTGWKLGLHTADPGEAGTANEVVGGSYARTSCTFAAASGGSIALSGAVTFTGMPAITGATYITHVSIWENGGTSRYLGSMALAVQKQVANAGDSFVLSTGSFSLD